MSNFNSLVFDNIPDSLRSFKGQGAQKFIQEDSAGLIWHISDLHFGSGGILNPGHNLNLVSAVVEMMKNRPLNKDVLLITGDCTTNGKVSDVRLFKKFIDDIRPHFREIIVIPGNHDGWNTLNAFTVVLWQTFRTLFDWVTFGRILTRRKLPIDSLKLFDFSKSSFSFKTLDWVGKSIKIMSVDTTFRDRIAIAQGQFPDSAQLAGAHLEIEKGGFDFCIMLLHHHIIRYSEPINSNFAFIKHDLSMRLFNADVAKNFIKASNIKLILHGHRHTRAKEVMLNSQGQALICAAPAAFLNSVRGGGHGYVGFNIFRIRKGKVFLANMLYRDGYMCDDITQLELI